MGLAGPAKCSIADKRPWSRARLASSDVSVGGNGVWRHIYSALWSIIQRSRHLSRLLRNSNALQMSTSTPNKPIGLGFVGLSAKGWASSVLAPPLFQAPLNQQYKLVAVSTSRAASAEESAKAHTEKTGHTVKGYHGSTAAIAADPDVQFVAVSVKTPDHAAAIKPILAAKKDVFSEWPLGKNLEETRELAALAKEAGVRTLIGTQAWQSPLVNKVKMTS